ncbi:SCO2521 family protein [Cryptosporangium minutisporangium]|uniref:TIR domain-containing protein n=1 Tax=Cryptosporangium minutisporangium TaxID=113569 RepID=A0ABP6T368_9ACTN
MDRRDIRARGAPLLIGEVRTGLLQHSTPVSAADATTLLGLRRGEVPRVRADTAPSRIVSAPGLIGVDCWITSGPQTNHRLVGTVVATATLVGGQLLQTSSSGAITGGRGPRREVWAHYLFHPGRLEIVGGDPHGSQLADAFVNAANGGPDLGSIADNLMSSVQRASLLDRRPFLRASRTQLRWVLDPTIDASESVVASAPRPHAVALQVRSERVSAAEIADLMEDLAMRNWLLAAAEDLAARAATADRTVRTREHLRALWGPRDHLTDAAGVLWASVDERLGLTRRWVRSTAASRPVRPTRKLPVREPSPNGGGIFISYHSADAGYLARLLAVRLRETMPGRTIFLDVNEIPHGADVEQAIDTALARTSTMVVLVGQAWSAGPLGEGLGWLTTSLVRDEIAGAFARGIKVVPVTLDEAKLPRPHELPEELAAFGRINPIPVHYRSLDSDLSTIVAAME